MKKYRNLKKILNKGFRALGLAKVFGRSPEGWLKLQLQYDLWTTQQSVDLKNIKRIIAA